MSTETAEKPKVETVVAYGLKFSSFGGAMILPNRPVTVPKEAAKKLLDEGIVRKPTKAESGEAEAPDEGEKEEKPEAKQRAKAPAKE